MPQNQLPNKPAHTAPPIAREHHKDGVRYYTTTDGRLFLADVYDRIFRPVKTKVNKKARGKNPSSLLAAFED